MHSVQITDNRGYSLHLKYWGNFIFSIHDIDKSLEKYNCVFVVQGHIHYLNFNTYEDFIYFQLEWS
jgi:hypothetical protein